MVIAKIILLSAALALTTGCSTFSSKSSPSTKKRRKVKRNYLNDVNLPSNQSTGRNRGSSAGASPSASQEYDDSWADRYLGVTGYFKRPPLFATNSEAKKYQRCKPFEITSFEFLGDRITVIAEQGGQSIRMIGLNRRPFKLEGAKRLTQVDHHFVKSLDVIRKAKKAPRAVDFLCRGQVWKNMSKEQFLFIHGAPEKIIKGTGKYAHVYQWIYRGVERDTTISYYFANGLLWSWDY